MCLGSPLEGQHRGAAKNSREYYRGGVVSLPTPKCPYVTQGSPGVVWLVLEPHHGDSRTQGSRCGGQASKERLGCPKSGHGCPERHHECPESSHGCPSGVELVLRLHQECPGVVKLVMEIHCVSQEGKQGEFRDSGVSVCASPCEFRW